MLSENYFMDNKSDLEYLQNQTGKQAIIDTHVKIAFSSIKKDNAIQKPAVQSNKRDLKPKCLAIDI